MVVLGLSNMRDAAAALVADGRIVAAAEEERFVRQKHVTALPVHAIQYCLREAGIALRDVEAIVVPWKYWQVGRRLKLALTAMLRSTLLGGRARLDASGVSQAAISPCCRCWMARPRLGRPWRMRRCQGPRLCSL